MMWRASRANWEIISTGKYLVGDKVGKKWMSEFCEYGTNRQKCPIFSKRIRERATSLKLITEPRNWRKLFHGMDDLIFFQSHIVIKICCVFILIVACNENRWQKSSAYEYLTDEYLAHLWQFSKTKSIFPNVNRLHRVTSAALRMSVGSMRITCHFNAS